MLAINGYIGPSRPYVDAAFLSTFDTMTIDDLFSEITVGGIVDSGASVSDLNSVYTEHAALAASKNLDFIAYEGGNFMELDGAPQSTVDMFYEANQDVRMPTAFVDNVNNFIAAGGKDFFFFLNEDLWTAEGAFGARRYQDQTREEAVVFDGLMDFIETTPCSWADCKLLLPQ